MNNNPYDGNIIKVELRQVNLDREHQNLPTNRKAVLSMYPDAVDATISVIAYNRLDVTKICIESILKYTTDISYKLILVYNDNEAGEGILDYFKSVDYDNKLIIHMSQNIGLGLATKEVLKYVEGKYYIGLANDTIVTTNWLSNLIKCADSDERTGMVTPVSSNVSNRQWVELHFSNYEEMQKEAAKYNVSDFSKWEERLRLVTICPLITRDCLETIGNVFDLGMIHDFMDDELSFRIRRAGYKCILAKDTWVHHDHSYELRDSDKLKKSFVIGNSEFKEKFFGLESWKNTNELHQEYANAIENCMSKKPRILGVDVKCGSSILQIKNKLRSFDIRAVEMYSYTQNIEYYQDLQTVCGSENVVSGKEHDIFLHYNGQKFDYIVLGEYINKYNDPIALLKYLSLMLSDDGQLFLSIKNVFDIFSFFRLTGYVNVQENEFYKSMFSDDLFRITSELGLELKYLMSFEHSDKRISQEEIERIHGILLPFAKVCKEELMRRLVIDRHAYVIKKQKKEKQVENKASFNKTVTESYLNFLFDLIKQGDIDKAKELYFDMKSNMCGASSVEVFGLLLGVYEKEKHHNEENVFSGKEPLSALLEEYDKLKFLIRRFDFDVEDAETAQELIRFVFEKNVSVNLLKCVVENSIINREKVIKKLVNLFQVQNPSYALRLTSL